MAVERSRDEGLPNNIFYLDGHYVGAKKLQLRLLDYETNKRVVWLAPDATQNHSQPLEFDNILRFKKDIMDRERLHIIPTQPDFTTTCRIIMPGKSITCVFLFIRC
jgi:hypothetical protein